MCTTKHAILTVKMVGVTNAQQTFQKMFGWNPIIISISSQNRCKPANRQVDMEHEVQWQGVRGREGAGQALEPLTQVPLARDDPSLVTNDPYYARNHQKNDSLPGRLGQTEHFNRY